MIPDDELAEWKRQAQAAYDGSRDRDAARIVVLVEYIEELKASP